MENARRKFGTPALIGLLAVMSIFTLNWAFGENLMHHADSQTVPQPTMNTNAIDNPLGDGNSVFKTGGSVIHCVTAGDFLNPKGGGGNGTGGHGITNSAGYVSSRPLDGFAGSPSSDSGGKSAPITGDIPQTISTGDIPSAGGDYNPSTSLSSNILSDSDRNQICTQDMNADTCFENTASNSMSIGGHFKDAGNLLKKDNDRGPKTTRVYRFL